MGQSGKIKSFSELASAVKSNDLERYLSSDLNEKREYLKRKGIILKGKYVGEYNADSNSVTIPFLTNPFNRQPLNAILLKKVDLKDKTPVAITLVTGTIKGEICTPETVFFCEVIDDVNNKAASKKQKQKNNDDRIQQLQSENRRLEQGFEAIRQGNLKLLKENTYLRNRLISSNIEKGDNDIEIAKVLYNRNIRHLLHVTRVENLESIIEEGIRPRNSLRSDAVINDQNRFDRRPDCVSLSVGRMNSYYFKSIVSDNLYKNNNVPRFVCIFIDSAILFDKNTKYYCMHNAATNSINIATNQGLLTKAKDFEAMFAETISYQKSMEPVQTVSRTAKHKSNWPTSIQAEILYCGVIDPGYIRRVEYSDRICFDRYKRMLGMRGIISDVNNNLLF